MTPPDAATTLRTVDLDGEAHGNCQMSATKWLTFHHLGGYTSTMTQTQQTSRTTHSVTRDGETIGRITCIGATYRAARKTGEAGVDIRRVSQGFRTVEAAARWIERA